MPEVIVSKFDPSFTAFLIPNGIEIYIFQWIKNSFMWKFENLLLAITIFNLAIAGLSLRIGGHLMKGPYLPETLEGITKTSKAVFGK